MRAVKKKQRKREVAPVVESEDRYKHQSPSSLHDGDGRKSLGVYTAQTAHFEILY